MKSSLHADIKAGVILGTMFIQRLTFIIFSQSSSDTFIPDFLLDCFFTCSKDFYEGYAAEVEFKVRK